MPRRSAECQAREGSGGCAPDERRNAQSVVLPIGPRRCNVMPDHEVKPPCPEIRLLHFGKVELIEDLPILVIEPRGVIRASHHSPSSLARSAWHHRLHLRLLGRRRDLFGSGGRRGYLFGRNKEKRRGVGAPW